MDELIALINATIVDPTLAAKLIADIKTKELAVRTKDEQKQFETNFLEQNKDTLTQAEKQAMRIRIEDDIKSAIPGFKQNPSEPYHEFMKRGIKSLQDKVNALTTEKTALEQAKAGDADSVWKTKYETLEQQSKAALTVKDQEIVTLRTTTAKQERLTKLQEVFGPIESKFMDQLPGYFNDYKRGVVDSVLNSSAMIDGVLVLVDENGNPRKDTNLNNITVEGHLKERFKDVIKPDVQQPGTGNKNSGKPPATPQGTGVNTGAIPNDVDTQNKLTQWLGKQGLLQGSKEFDEAFSKAVTERKIEKIF